jgi:tetratricopeptide (TPR) repeat protein
MAAPNYFSARRGPEPDFRRRIDDHYHLEMIAQNSSQIIEFQEELLRTQEEAALANLREIEQVAENQSLTNELLSLQIEQGTELHATALSSLAAIMDQTQVLGMGLAHLANNMLKQQQMLEQISDILRRPYETKALELCQEAERALKQGMKTTGRDQTAEYEDAMRLLTEVLENPIGRRNYVAWFQNGWLTWKHRNNIPEAENCFYQAARLSAPNNDAYYPLSLRHMAYTQYLQDKNQEAYESIHKALQAAPADNEIRYDTARYAAKTGRKTEALELLERCIEQEPAIIVTMFSEKDFS